MSLTLPMLHDRDRVNIVELGRLHPAVSFARASTATYMGSGGVLKTAAVNEPRYEYDASGNYLGLLIEEQRTNSLLNSVWAGGGSAPTSWSFPTGTGSSSPVASILGSADGSSAYQLSVISNGDRPFFQYNLLTLSASTTYTLKVYIEAVSGSGMTIGYLFPFFGTQTYAAALVYDIDGVTKTSSSNVVSGRLHIKFTTKATVGTFNPRFGPGANGSGVVGQSLTISRPQVETGAFATSYIPTTTAAVTRSADVAQAVSLSALGINTTAGTFVIQHDAPTGAPLIYSGSNKILDSAGGTKVAIAYDASGTRTSVNGAATTTGAALTWSTTLDLLRSATTSANAHVKSLTWYNTKRAASELQRLSA